MEKGIKIDLLNNKIPKNYNTYQWVYIGSEFCENLLPLFLNKLHLINKLQSKKLCLQTPIITEKSISILKKIILKLMDMHFKDIEISCNDLGTLKILEEIGYKGNISFGRYLTKIIFSCSDNKIKLYDKNSLLFFYKKYKIKRYEISMFPDKIITNFTSYRNYIKNINFSFFFPYEYITTTRLCIFIDKLYFPETKIKTVDCEYQCLKKTDKFKNNNIFFYTNSLFRFHKINESIIKYNFKKIPEINRIIFSTYP